MYEVLSSPSAGRAAPRRSPLSVGSTLPISEWVTTHLVHSLAAWRSLTLYVLRPSERYTKHRFDNVILLGTLLEFV